MFWLSGSHKFQLMHGVSESLAGRIGIIDLLGFSQKEINKIPSKSKRFIPRDRYKEFNSLNVVEVYENIWKGSFPGLYREKNIDWNRFYYSYVQTYIERDIRSFTNVSDDGKFVNFLKIIASRTGGILNYSEVSKELGISLNSVKNWTYLLLRTGIIFLLPAYYINISRPQKYIF